MPRYRTALPQLEEGSLFLTDGGLETVLIFHEGIELPHFAACDLLRSPEGRSVLRSYYDKHAMIADRLGVGFIVDTPTWRANPDWTDRLGYDRAEFAAVNREGVRLASKIRAVWETDATPVVIAAVVGPRGDGSVPSRRRTAERAAGYHASQIELFADSDADLVSALTIGDPEEAVGLARAARAAGIPITISFTLGVDGRLPGGARLADAIMAVDDDTDCYPSYYMINCSHPTHLPADLAVHPVYAERVRGYRANASSASTAELDVANALDTGDPGELADQFRLLSQILPRLGVVGGCCGTDFRHIEAIGRALIGAHVAR